MADTKGSGRWERASGAADYFAEPFDTQTLVAIVRRVLDDGPSSGLPPTP
jgi:DNA-binding response OmpR family regulator